LFYLLTKVLIARRPRQIRRTMDRSTAIILAIGTRNSVDALRALRLIEQDGDRFRLVEPPHRRGDPAEALRGLLAERGIDPRSPVVRSAVDMLHLLEFYAVTLPRDELAKRVEDLRNRHPAFFDEAVSLASVLVQVLPGDDPESDLVRRVVEAVLPGGVKVGLERWTRGGE